MKVKKKKDFHQRMELKTNCQSLSHIKMNECKHFYFYWIYTRTYVQHSRSDIGCSTKTSNKLFTEGQTVCLWGHAFCFHKHWNNRNDATMSKVSSDTSDQAVGFLKCLRIKTLISIFHTSKTVWSFICCIYSDHPGDFIMFYYFFFILIIFSFLFFNIKCYLVPITF